MPTPSIPQIIIDAKISQFLSSNDIRKSGLFAGGIDINLPRKLYNIRKSVEYWYNLDSTDDTLSATSKYLYALCGKYSLIAGNVSGAGGTISPVTPFSTPSPIEFVVDNSGTFMITGQQSVTITQFIGYNIMLNWNYVPQTQVVDVANTYFTWNRDTGLLTLSREVYYQEILSINAV